jgi:Zn-dependent membrane protease YugP
VVSSLLTLPVEFNASKRALKMINDNNIITDKKELKGAKKVLRAAALTYVASTITSLANLLALILTSRKNAKRKKQQRR